MSDATKEEKSSRIHNFYDKLRQQSVFAQFLCYVEFQRKIQKNKEKMFKVQKSITDNYSPNQFNSEQKAVLSNEQYIGPSANISILSVNLDITTACNHACTFCVDYEVTNTGHKLTCNEVFKTIDTLTKSGLCSVILIGGGEPTLHPDFVDVVSYIKGKGLQLGIVSNGTQAQKILEIVPLLQKNDYIRFSIDAGVNATYQKIHNPKSKGNSLAEVLCLAKEVKLENEEISLGYSFVICWDGIIFNGKHLHRNIEEIPSAYQNCLDYNFDYLSLKPCLVKEPKKPVETICAGKSGENITQVCSDIIKQIQIAEKNVDKNIPIVQSINLRGLLTKNLDSLRSHPRICHAGFFRQVITPYGIYHCPAYRGSGIAFVGNALGYTSQKSANLTYRTTAELLMRFDASIGCKDIACFYNKLNHSIQNLIDSDDDLCKLENTPDQDFFL